MSSSISERLARFSANANGTAYTWGDMLMTPEATELNRLSMAYIQAIYPDGFDGFLVLETGVNPVDCDAHIRGSKELMHFDQILAAEAQGAHWWVSHGENYSLGPAAEEFLHPAPLSDFGKPTRGAFFSCNGSNAWPGLWHVYVTVKSVLDGPWLLWRLLPREDLVVHTVRSAVDWCELVLEYGVESPAGLTIDWAAASSRLDAVELDLKAVAAIDCLGLRYKGIAIAPSFWGVPTTVWLKWEFAKVAPSDLPLRS